VTTDPAGLGNTWLGEPTLNEGRLVLEGCSEIEPGEEGLAHLEPLAPEFWGTVHIGSVITMHEGKHVVGDATILRFASQPEHFTPEELVFVNQARQFCDFIERASGLSLSARLSGLRQRLLDLSRAGSALPQVEPPDGVDAGPTRRGPRTGSSSKSSSSLPRCSTPTSLKRPSPAHSQATFSTSLLTCVAASTSGTKTSPKRRHLGVALSVRHPLGRSCD
jgi:hypothetical protein